MTARIRTNRPVFDVYGTLQEVAPILAWIADQAPSARVKFDGDDDEQRVTQWFEFTVWFADETDELNFKMFQSEAFEAGTENAEFQIGASPFHNVWGPVPNSAIVLNPTGGITGIVTKPRGGK